MFFFRREISFFFFGSISILIIYGLDPRSPFDFDYGNALEHFRDEYSAALFTNSSHFHIFSRELFFL